MHTDEGAHAPTIAIVGRGRMGHALAGALALPDQPFGRGFDGAGYDVVILAVPDREIANAAATVITGPLVGHCSGLLGLDVLGDREAFGLHPLMTVTTAKGASFLGATAAIEGTTAGALAVARSLAAGLGMSPFEISTADRPAYHAAASIAANFLTALEDAAERLMATTGNSREVLVPLVRAAVENWAAGGGRAALTGPIARGDESTVAMQRATITQRCPDMVPMFDVMADLTRALVARRDE